MGKKKKKVLRNCPEINYRVSGYGFEVRMSCFYSFLFVYPLTPHDECGAPVSAGSELRAGTTISPGDKSSTVPDLSLRGHITIAGSLHVTLGKGMVSFWGVGEAVLWENLAP